ncbi:MAG: aminotransferase class I/II-fold pyridoxal phosphate-dependent enzyme [Christensenellales bacterium]|jgi:arginine decarboxylase
MELYELLERYAKGHLPMHMPGHKRNAALAPYLTALRADLDITEIDGFDNLHDARGILQSGMARTAALWGSRRAFWLVNGSTVGILAAVWAVVPHGGRVVCARNCHGAVHRALSVRRAQAAYILPEVDRETGIPGGLDPAAVARALDANPGTHLLILTSPTYEGAISDIPAICAAAHARGVPVLVDEAHGAHLGFGHGFPDGAVRAGADVVVQSLHKTLPSLTQTAVLHTNGARVDASAIGEALQIFQTSSPSYLLMASIEGLISLLEARGDALFSDWRAHLRAFHRRAEHLNHLRIWTPRGAHDPSKIVIRSDRAGITGAALAERLRQEYRMELEMAAGGYALAMTGMGDTRDTLDALADALLALDRTTAPALPHAFPPPVLPPRVLHPWVAADLPCAPVDVRHAAGRVSAEAIWAYPPGIPLVLPGEMVSDALIDCISAYAASGIRLQGTKGAMPRAVHVLAESSLTKPGAHDNL